MISELLVVGSGLYGLTVARLSAEAGVNVTVLEKRDHIGGNSYSKVDPETNVDVHVYGSHLFHTNNLRIWNFINQFSRFNNYRHFVVANTQGEFLSVPPNIATFQRLYPEAHNLDELWALVHSDSELNNGEIGLEAKAVSQMGRRAFDRLIKGYTQKQWQVPPSELPEDTINRLPIRRDHSPWYFNDKYQGVPLDGYGNLAKSIADHPKIRVELETDFMKNRDSHLKRPLIVYTGALDSLLDFRFGDLGWRTVEFEITSLRQSDFQGAAVVNYPDLSVPFTRIHEFKHLHPEKTSVHKGTTIAREFSRISLRGDEPYYPINSAFDRNLAKKYRGAIAKAMPNVHLGGRLATYTYLDMHMAVGSAITDFESKILPRLTSGA